MEIVVGVKSPAGFGAFWMPGRPWTQPTSVVLVLLSRAQRASGKSRSAVHWLPRALAPWAVDPAYKLITCRKVSLGFNWISYKLSSRPCGPRGLLPYTEDPEMVRLPGKLGMEVPNAGRFRHHSDEILHTRVNSGSQVVDCRRSKAVSFQVAVAKRERQWTPAAMQSSDKAGRDNCDSCDRADPGRGRCGRGLCSHRLECL